MVISQILSKVEDLPTSHKVELPHYVIRKDGKASKAAQITKQVYTYIVFIYVGNGYLGILLIGTNLVAYISGATGIGMRICSSLTGDNYVFGGL